MSTIALPQEQTINEVRFKRIVVATDFSATSGRALAYGLAIARRHGAEISFVHAIPPEPRESVPMDALPGELNREQLHAQEEMRKIEEMPFGNVQHKSSIVEGDVAEVISSIIDRDHADLLVLGTHGRGVLKKLALGSVAEEALRVVSSPVLAVGPQCAEAETDAECFKTILFATDFGAASSRAFPLALALAENCQAKLALLHMVPPTSFADVGVGGYGPAAYSEEELKTWHEQVQEESLRKLKALIPSGANLRTEPEYIVRTDFLPDGILEAAAIHKSELIVMGASRARSPRIAAHVPWAVVHNVLCEAKCPVLTVRD